MSRKIGVVRFPGTNCDQDVFSFVQHKGFAAEYLWHLDQFEISKYEAVILPGGFSYGDYLRSGALAARSPVMKSVKEFANKGGFVLGICNGFQILCETHLLPGALVQNQGRRFIDGWVDLELKNNHGFFGKGVQVSEKIKLPIAHGDGRYFASTDEVKKITDAGQVWLTYQQNPNGSVQNIAGVMNQKKNVVGLMPHPERALFDWMGGVDGGRFL